MVGVSVVGVRVVGVSVCVKDTGDVGWGEGACVANCDLKVKLSFSYLPVL